MTHDVMVVGSGFAGGVTAARLAEHGVRVLVLKRGVWRGPAGPEDAPASYALALVLHPCHYG